MRIDPELAMRVSIPTPLRSYTHQQGWVEANGSTLQEVFADLDAQFPGIRFRFVDEQGQLRRHMKVFVGQEVVRDLTLSVTENDVVTLMQALSGG